MLVDESKLRYPSERPILIASVVLNFVLMGLAITLLFYEPQWVKVHPILDKEIGFLRILATTALVGIPLLVFERNRRESAIRGDSVRVTDQQFPEIHAVLLEHCRTLGMTKIPELFITANRIAPFSQTFSSWREDYIVLHQAIFDIDDAKTMDVVSFMIAHELGAVRLKHRAMSNEILLTYISAFPFLRNPLARARVFSRDRYGATLAPTGFRGLLIEAIGRRLMDRVVFEPYAAEVRQYGGVWPILNVFFERKPQVLTRLKRLRDAGYRYKAPQQPVTTV